jgi:hypothetical protein
MQGTNDEVREHIKVHGHPTGNVRKSVDMQEARTRRPEAYKVLSANRRHRGKG